MHNYHNIIPTIILDVLIILIFEGLLFFLYLEKQQEKIINTQLSNFFNTLQGEKQSHTTSTSNTNLFITLGTIMQPYIQTAMEKEQNFIEKQYKIGIIIYCATLLSLIIGLIIYSYIVYNILGKTINWRIVIITIVITIIFIIIMEMLYVKYVLFNKKFNESQIKLDFINALQS